MSADGTPADAELRRDARACWEAALAAVAPGPLVERALSGDSGLLATEGAVEIVAIGKAAAPMATAAVGRLGERVVGGVLLAPASELAKAPAALERFAGGHPLPNEEGRRGAARIHELAGGLGEGDTLLCLISGGGSALMTLPPAGVSLEDVQRVTAALLAAGATIGELNCVRKHLDLLKGGRLARRAAPARVVALILSDVVGDPLEVIASGPVSPDPTTFEEAVGVLRGRRVWERVPETVRDYLSRGRRGKEPDSPGAGDPCFEVVQARIVGSNRMAADAAARRAEELGYRSLLLSTRITGEAREVGRVLGALALESLASGSPLPPPACLVAAGETTVTVRGRGRGGRNQEVTLGAAAILDGSTGALIASFGTDGVDGPTDAAGAVADGDTVRRGREAGLDLAAALDANDAYPYLKALDDLILTGPTGTNVMDVMLVFTG